MRADGHIFSNYIEEAYWNETTLANWQQGVPTRNQLNQDEYIRYYQDKYFIGDQSSSDFLNFST